MTRYALYFAPDADWWRRGSMWLGRDAISGQQLPQPAIAGLAADMQWQLTRDARRYGFHATLKAPFQLADGLTEANLHQALQEFCKQQNHIKIQAPEVQWMGKFLALRPTGEQPALNEFAFACVSHFDHFRAPMSRAELARRQQMPLSPRQNDLLLEWGYPYTAEEFRFHITLTDRLDAGAVADSLHRAACQYFAVSEPLIINGISLFIEPQAGQDFELLRRFSFS
jgi:putative phosphonate metabolism protein